MTRSIDLRLLLPRVTTVAFGVVALNGCNVLDNRSTVLPTANMKIQIDGRVVVDQNDLIGMSEGPEYDGFGNATSLYVSLKFRKESAKRLRRETGANIGNPIEVWVDGKLLCAELITHESDSVDLDYKFGSKDSWMVYFFGKRDVNVSKTWDPSTDARQ